MHRHLSLYVLHLDRSRRVSVYFYVLEVAVDTETVTLAIGI